LKDRESRFEPLGLAAPIRNVGATAAAAFLPSALRLAWSRQDQQRALRHDLLLFARSRRRDEPLFPLLQPLIGDLAQVGVRQSEDISALYVEAELFELREAPGLESLRERAWCEAQPERRAFFETPKPFLDLGLGR
jgi:hypothetical protein